MAYTDYIGNVCRLAVELVNSRGECCSELAQQMYAEHDVTPPTPARLAAVLPMMSAALAAVADHDLGERPLAPVNALLRSYPPSISVSDHDGAAHVHFASDRDAGADWTARSCGAALAYVMSGEVPVTVGRCAAEGCDRFFVDDSRNRSRRFCSSTCASRTTVSAYRTRRKAG